MSELHLPDMAEATGLSLALPGKEVSAADRVLWVRRLPVVLTTRVLIGIVVQVGNLLTKSSRG